SKQERADADESIKDARKTQEWTMPLYRQLGAGLGELRWWSEGKQQRLLGFFVGEVWYAVIGCKHKGKIYQPAECLDTARGRKTELEQKLKKGADDTFEYDL